MPNISHIHCTLYSVQGITHPYFPKRAKKYLPNLATYCCVIRKIKTINISFFYFLSLSTVFRRSCVETVFVLQEKISIQDINHY